ncbi:DUF1194 domain-containing protein [uncultured Shimia sp.]|uniref:DUF1194 domain-containing protein n=1 Tax=uncultured Shimia sp. TaxID=573152 RepID=UPI00263229CD|nr:DUF1194 domain-containing protein [uncultured Shimia sp.]
MTRLVIPLLAALMIASGAQADCRQALALGLDVSGSVDTNEYRLQLDGLAAALSAPEVREVLLAEPDWPVRLAVFEWSGPRQFNRRLLVGWTEVTTLQDLDQIIALLHQTQRRPADPSTALGSAITYGTELLEIQSDCPKRTLDISGDGKSNTGPLPQSVPSPGWLVVNGLTIGDDSGNAKLSLQELSAYYTANVIRGPGAFVETAQSFDDYERAMARKLLRELQGLSLAGSTPEL